LRWTEEAADDLEHITNYLFEDAPSRAVELVREIYAAPSVLLKFPYRGRPGRKTVPAVTWEDDGVDRWGKTGWGSV